MLDNKPMIENRPLIEYLPVVLRNIQEFKVLADAEEPELAELWLRIKNALDDQFNISLTEYGLTRWEKILKIIPKTPALKDRRSVILTKLTAQPPFTIRMLHRMLTELCGPDNYEIKLDAGNYTIRVLLEWLGDAKADAVAQLLRRICPANLICEVTHDALVLSTIHYMGSVLESWNYTFNTVLKI